MNLDELAKQSHRDFEYTDDEKSYIDGYVRGYGMGSGAKYNKTYPFTAFFTVKFAIPIYAMDEDEATAIAEDIAEEQCTTIGDYAKYTSLMGLNGMDRVEPGILTEKQIRNVCFFNDKNFDPYE